MYLAIDIGGTKTLIALFSKRGRVVRRVKFKTAYGKEKFLRDLGQNLRDFASSRVAAVTVAVPGHIKRSGGDVFGEFTGDFGDSEHIFYSAKLGNRDWGWFDISTPIKKLFNCPIYFENDANLASFYESSGIAGRTMFLTFSTGIGGGLAEDGRLLLSDADKFEPGHKIYEYMGKKAEWEDIAAASALEKAYHVDLATEIRGKAAMQDIAARMALGLTDLVAEHHPDTIIIGGPMGKIFKRFSKYLPDLGVEYRRPKRPLESVVYGCYIFSKNQE